MEMGNTIASKMKYFRKIKNMKQEDLANASGINYGLIRLYETNRRFPKYEQLKLIASGLGVNISVFLDLDIKTSGDAMALVSQLDDVSGLMIDGEKDEDGNYIPSSIHLSFEEDSVNELLAKYLSLKELASSQSDKIDYVVSASDDKGKPIDIEEEKYRLLTDETPLNKPY